MKKHCIILLLLAALLLSGCGDTGEQPGQEVHLQVYCFSFGKADAFLLTTEHGAVLIDTGNKGCGKEILAYCRDKGV